MSNTKSLVQSKKAVAALRTSLEVKNHELVQNETFLEAIETIAVMQEAIDEFWGSMQQFMIEKKIEPIKGDWGHITLAPRRTLMGSTTNRNLTKRVLDTEKVRAWAALHGNTLPEGVSEKKTLYLSKRIHL